jgi:hypothetical protein
MGVDVQSHAQAALISERSSLAILQEVVWAPWSVWTAVEDIKSVASTGFWATTGQPVGLSWRYSDPHETEYISLISVLLSFKLCMTQFSFSVPHNTACSYIPLRFQNWLKKLFFNLYPAGMGIKILAHGLGKHEYYLNKKIME